MNRKTILLVGLLLLAVAALSACGGSSAPEPTPIPPTAVVVHGDAQAGDETYHQLCVACHGPGGEGVDGLGKPFTTSDFVRSLNDEELLAFIKTGRTSTDPANTTGIDMPPKGGNPALSDDQISDIIAYIRTLQQ